MSDEDENTPDEEAQFVFPIMLNSAQQKEAMDRHQLSMVELKMSIDRFFDEITPDQLYTFYRMMGFISDKTSQFWSGQASAILRIVHKMCASCGNGLHDVSEHFLPKMPDVNGDVADESTPREILMKKYGVEPLPEGPDTGQVQCIECGLIFATLELRAETSECPGCRSMRQLYGESDT